MEPEHPSKRVKLLTSLEKPTATADNIGGTQLWFSQDVFSGMDDLRDIADEDEKDDMDDGTGDGWLDVRFRPVYPVSTLIPFQESSEENSDGFETVPKDQDDDLEMWNGEADNEDEMKKEKIKSVFICYAN